jgi:hypothetical protein
MTVAELIEILKKCDPSMHVATAATNSIQFGEDSIRVHLLNSYEGDRVLIGDPDKKNLNRPNWGIERALDGGEELKQEWPRWVPGNGYVDGGTE